MLIEVREVIKLSEEEDETIIDFCNIMLEGIAKGSDSHFCKLCQEILNKIDDFKEYLN